MNTRKHFIALLLMIISGVPFSCSSSAGGKTSGNMSAAIGNESDSKERPVFSSDSAMRNIKVQVDFGPRVPGSVAHGSCADWLTETLKRYGAEVTDTTVMSVNPENGKMVKIRNIFGRFNPRAKDRILLVAHYDTRPWADEDADKANHKTPIDGANDGASGVGVILEVARHADNLGSKRGLDVLFTDYEDSGTSGNDDTWCLGSTRWANYDMPYAGTEMPRFGILLDMVGGKDAVFMREMFSEMYAKDINDIVWKAAFEAGYGDRFVDRIGGAINDDHLPLLKVGIPTIDIIEMRVGEDGGGFNPTWHTLQDTYENIDAATVKAAGDVVMKLIY